MERCDHCNAECENQYCEFCAEFARFDDNDRYVESNDPELGWFDDDHDADF